MNTRPASLLACAALSSVVAVLTACGGSSSDPVSGADSPVITEPPEVTEPTPGSPAPSAPAPGPVAPAPDGPPPPVSPPPAPTPTSPGPDGKSGRVAVNQHCCYGGAYYRCPNTAACFGGVDLAVCLSGCTSASCFSSCAALLDAAGPPVGCAASTAPAGVDCANGRIDL